MQTVSEPLRPVRPLRLPRRMAPTDALFWYAESALPQLRPIIAGLYLLDRPPEPAGIEAGYELALVAVPRLRQRVVEVPLHLGLPEWAEDAHFDRSYHLRHVSLPAPGTLRELLDLSATLLATPLDRERPLWEAYWIDGLEGGRAAYLLKMHHAVVDGVGSIALLDALTQTARDAEVPRARAPLPHPARSPGLGSRLASLALHDAAEGVRLGWRAAGMPFRLGRHPAGTLRDAWRTVRGLRGLLADASSARIEDPLAIPGAGLSRRLDVADVPLERLKKIRAPLGVTINDVVLAVLAGALGDYHRERDVHVAELNCMVPMSLRARDERDLLGNRVGTFTVRLPLGETDARRRLTRIADQTRAAKDDQRGAAAPFLVGALTMLPGGAFRWLARRGLGRVNVACTNIPGVPERRYMAGARVDALYPFASVVEGTPVVVALLSYAGTMHIGIDTDPEAIPDPHRLVELLLAGLDEMEVIGR